MAFAASPLHYLDRSGADWTATRHDVARLDAAWRAADTAPDGVITAIRAIADAPPDVAITRLLPWLHDRRWLCDRVEAALALMRRDKFARPPLTLLGGADGDPGGLVLVEQGAIRLTLHLRPPALQTAAVSTVIFAPGRAALHILASGGAMLLPHNVAVTAAEEGGGFTTRAAAACHSGAARPLITGETLCLDTARQAVSLVEGRTDSLLLLLSVQPPSRLPIRTYDAATGRLLHVSASDRDASFRQMALTLLRNLGRTDAAPLFVAASGDRDFALRWSAMRDLVALDRAAAQEPLQRMAADDPHPEVRAAAAATLTLLASALVSAPANRDCQCPSA